MYAILLRSESVCLSVSLLALTLIAGSLQADLPPAETLSRELVTSPTPARVQSTHEPRLFAPNGIVFINGRHLEPPYVLETTAAGVLVNGQLLESPLSLRLVQGDLYASPDMAPTIHPRQFVRHVKETLTVNGFLIAFAGEPTCVISDLSESYLPLLRALNGEGNGDYSLLFATLQEPVDEPTWTNWLNSRPAPPSVLDQVDAALQARQELEDSNMQAIQAHQSLESAAYPLTTLGMMICVFSIGHLLLYRPDPQAKPDEINDAPHLLKMVRTSLILIVVFSALDLVWTLLAHQAGQMKELNPLGNGLIDDPLSLAIFKGVATLVAVGVLFAVRKYSRGQLATWWVCLTVTLITVRWVAFNSMFVS